MGSEHEYKMAIRAEAETKWVEKTHRWSKTRSWGGGIQEFEALVDFFFFGYFGKFRNRILQRGNFRVLCMFLLVTSEMFVLILECSPPV